jgi:YggT family protein
MNRGETMLSVLAQAISIFSQVLIFIVLAHVILSYFMDPYHPVRAFIDRLVEPLLAPIRRWVPLVGMMDFSPVILILLVQFIAWILTWILVNILIGH